MAKGETFYIIAKWCGYSEDDDWFLIGLDSAGQRWVPGSRKHVATQNTERLVCLIAPPTVTPTPVNPNFRADQTTLRPGECATLRWDAEGVWAIYLNGESVTRHGVRRVCPPQTRTYVLTVKEQDGRRNDWRLTIQVKGSPLSAATPTPAATPSPTVIPTPTPEIVTDTVRLNELKLAILRFRQAEKAALRSPDAAVAAQLSAFAQGEALAMVLDQVAQLRNKKAYAELALKLEVQIAVLQDSQTAEVLAQEKRLVRVYSALAGDKRLIEEQVFDSQVVYSLVYLDSRWKVQRIRSASTAGQ